MSSFHVTLWSDSQHDAAVFKGGNFDMYRANIPDRSDGETA